MKWFKSYRRQGMECRETGNQFLVVQPGIFTKDPKKDVIVCVPFKTYCHSKACFEIRKEKGQE